MERIANSVMFPCKFSTTGCPAIFAHTDKTEHEELCEFRYGQPWKGGEINK
jgi:E3 ubiquitin-protein ligase SIAH1